MTLNRPGERAAMLWTFTVLLFCIWLSLGMTSIVMQSQPELWIETNYPKAPWENITLWCKSPSRISSKFLLLKDKTQMTWIRPSSKTFQVSFPIGALTKSNAGLYRCCYWKETGWSEPSKALELEAPGQLPKPIFWIQAETYPLTGCNVNILCHGWLQDLVFMLFKEGYAEPVDYQIPTGTVAIFSIANMTPESEGVYICRTHIQMLPTLWSEPSNPLKLIVAGLYPKPTLTAYPGPIMAPGESLNLRCQAPIYGMTFALIRLEDLKKSFYRKRPIKNEAYFFFRDLKIHDAGHYLCFYYDGSYRGSLLSDILKIWVTDTFPKTWLLAQPSPVVQMGQNVSLWCRGPADGVGLALYKKGEDKPLQLLDTTSIDDESFFLNNVTYSDAGIYSCHYLLSWKTSIRMTSHNTVELVVVDKPPKPSLSAWPSTMFKLGKAITLQHQVPHPVLEFSLEWEERATFQKFLVDGDFIISNAEGKGTETYSCSYRIESHPNIWSDRSEPLKLMGPAGFLTWNYVLNEAIRLSLIMQLVALLLVVLWIRWKCRRLRIREAWLLGTAQGVTMLFIVTALLCCGLCNGVLTEETEIIMPTPKPELWAETNFPLAPWKNLTLWCRSPSGSTKEFVLLKDGTGWIATRPASEQVRAAFPLGALTQSHTGSYHCHSWEEMAVSEPSEALELVGTDILPKPVISASPPIRGQKLQIRCKGWLAGMEFVLYKEGVQEPVQQLHAVGREAFFTIQRMEDKDEGNYSCRTHTEKRPFKWSEPSEPMELVIKDAFPKPWLFAEPSSVVPMGQNVTLWCRGPVHGVGYILHKEREATSVQLWGSTSNDGAFPITNISGANIGRYSCCYHPDWTSPIKIQPSNTLELIVTGLLPKPSLLAHPGPIVAPGENMTFQCQGELPDSTFVLLKEGTQQPLEHQSPSGYRADFWMPAVRGDDSGIYSCVYYLDSAPFAASNHSDFLEIWVTDKPPKPSLSAWPSTMFKLGKDITLQCRGPLPGVEFVLEHDGEEAPQQFSEDGDFVINNVEGKGIGNYSCSYRLQAYPDIWSEPSDALELVGAAGPAAQECTVGNIVRSSLIVVVVVALGVVLAIEWKKWPRLRTRDSETDGRDQTIALEECNQEGEPATNTSSPSSVSQGTSVELPVPV
ncbi:immunoglobulin superfamily member 1 isoform X5 [Vulpes lagopus]|uniref:immunoglobulin superfamily member 1 isoform X5 n=1 Tax=Vulpes lagopus TaxID=494514 RepID=UPI001BC9C9BD|nr:immunoglobulin superfamily member 1 isoform X5 [Vulpes lagopus]